MSRKEKKYHRNDITLEYCPILSPLWISVGLGLLFFLVIGIILLTVVVGIANKSLREVVRIKDWFRRSDWEHTEKED